MRQKHVISAYISALLFLCLSCSKPSADQATLGAQVSDPTQPISNLNTADFSKVQSVVDDFDVKSLYLSYCKRFGIAGTNPAECQMFISDCSNAADDTVFAERKRTFIDGLKNSSISVEQFNQCIDYFKQGAVFMDNINCTMNKTSLGLLQLQSSSLLNNINQCNKEVPGASNLIDPI